MNAKLSMVVAAVILNISPIASGLPSNINAIGIETNPLQQVWGLLSYTAPPDQPFLLKNALLTRAKADECFTKIGGPYSPAVNGKCDKGTPKTNEAYAWGLAQSGNKLVVGTASNVLCLAQSLAFNLTDPTLTKSWVCEYGQSGFRNLVSPPKLPAALGDWRPPNIYSYDLISKTSTPLTPKDPLIGTTLGLRSAGSLGNIAILGGPNFFGGVNFFSYNLISGAYLGSCSTTAFNNIRQFSVLNGILYAGVGTPIVGDVGGGVVRWVGTEDTPLSGGDVCGFQIVAKLPGDAAFLVSYGTKRLAASTWPGALGVGAGVGGVYLSPEIPSGGLTSTNAADAWKQLWKATNYEPDSITAKTTLGGAIAYWGGALYFGTMQVPGSTTFAHISCSAPSCYGPATDAKELLRVFLNTTRATSFWRIANADSPQPKVSLLYGETQLPALVPGTKKFVYKSTGFKPVFGKSGFGNPFNSYSWTAAVYKNKLYIGSFDSRYVIDALAVSLLTDQFGGIMKSLFASFNQAIPPLLQGYVKGFGADLWRFDSAIAAAQPLDVHGVGNYLNYGIRTMLPAANGRELFIGTANAMNLEAKGGWELRSLK